MARGNEPRLIAAHIAGQTLDQIARAAGVSRTTVQRRLKDPEFRARIARERDTAIGVTVRELATNRSAAVARLCALMGSTSDAIALRAAIALLRTSLDFEDMYEVSQRLSALETLAADLEADIADAEE